MRDSGFAISDEGFDGFHSNGDAHDEPLDGSVSTAASGSVVEEAALLGCAARPTAAHTSSARTARQQMARIMSRKLTLKLIFHC